jgi:hypothetical protein
MSMPSYETKNYGTTHQAVLEIVTSDLDVLERFISIVGAGSDPRPYNKGAKGTLPHHKQCYSWCCTNRVEVRRILSLFMPYLGMRRMMRAKELLEKMDEVDNRRGRCTDCGIKLTEENARKDKYYKSGFRNQCRSCASKREREMRAASSH